MYIVNRKIERNYLIVLGTYIFRVMMVSVEVVRASEVASNRWRN